MKNLYTLSLFLFIYISAYSGDIKIYTTDNWWKSYLGNISELDIEITPDHHYARVDLTFNINVDSTKNNYYEVPTYLNQLLEAQLDFSMPKGSYFYDSYLWLNPTVIIRADIIGSGAANSIYNGVVNRKSDPSILNKTYKDQYSLKVFPISTTFQRKVMLSFSVPFRSFQSNAEILELPSELMNMLKENSTITLKINKTSDIKFKNAIYPLNMKQTNNSPNFTFYEIAADRTLIDSKSNYLEFENLNPKIISLFYQQKSTTEGFYDLRIRTSQLPNFTGSTNIFEATIPFNTSGISYEKLNLTDNTLNSSESFIETGKYYGTINFSDSIRFKYKVDQTIYTINQQIFAKDSSPFIFQNWTNYFCIKNNNDDALKYSLKNRVLSFQTAFLALETGDTVKNAKNNYTIDNGDINVHIQNPSLETIKVYPNPVVDLFTVEAESTILSIKIIDITGKTVFSNSFKLPQTKIEINTTDFDLKEGVYFLEIETLKETKYMRILKIKN